MRLSPLMMVAADCMSLALASPAWAGEADSCQCAGWTLHSKPEEVPGAKCGCDQVCELVDEIEQSKANVAIYKDEALITAALKCFNALPDDSKKTTSPADLVTPIAMRVFRDWDAQYISCCKGRPWLVDLPEPLPDNPGPYWCPPPPDGSNGPQQPNPPGNVTVNMTTNWGGADPSRPCTIDTHGYEKRKCNVFVRGSCTHELTHCAQCKMIHSPQLWPASDAWLVNPVFEARSEWLAYEAGAAAQQEGLEVLAKSCGVELTCKRPPPDFADRMRSFVEQYMNLHAGGFL